MVALIMDTAWREMGQVCPVASGTQPLAICSRKLACPRLRSTSLWPWTSAAVSRHLEGGETGCGYTGESVNSIAYSVSDVGQGPGMKGQKTDGNTPPLAWPRVQNYLLGLGLEPGPVDCLLCDSEPMAVPLCALSSHL